jgi:hypothetical protein
MSVLDYVEPPPPDGHPDWPSFLRSIGVPESEFNGAAAIEDPGGTGPRIFIQQVPERKAGKNRVHLDVRVPGAPRGDSDERRAVLEREAVRLEALGAQRVELRTLRGQSWIVMQDPEGNEFCLD